MCFNVTQTQIRCQHKMVSRWCLGGGAPLWLQQNDRVSLLVFTVEMSYLRRNVWRPCLTGSCWCWRNCQGSATFCPGSYPPRSRPGWWERARGQAWVSSCHLATGGLEESFNKPSVINAETIALKAHRWISRLARGFNVSSPKPSDTLTSLYIIPKKLTASCNWNWISGCITAVPSPPFTLTLHLLSLHL